MDGASMQEFHRHTRYKNKLGLLFTLANESDGSFPIWKGDAHLTAQKMVLFTE